MKKPNNGIPKPDFEIKAKISLSKTQRKAARKKFNKFLWKFITLQWDKLI